MDFGKEKLSVEQIAFWMRKKINTAEAKRHGMGPGTAQRGVGVHRELRCR